MKVAVLSDIHGNLPALEAVAADIVAWAPDVTIVNGDVVNRGPSSLACWRFVQAQPDWHVVSGNHEMYVLLWADPDWAQAADGPDALYSPSSWTYAQLGSAVDELAA
ncbi:MAG: metallophosphoesterase, partial [Anaerolineae bacterium]|nr:metallophosphoesterase [Anaerolineae bacterium]